MFSALADAARAQVLILNSLASRGGDGAACMRMLLACA
jgi:hypothetical protein